MAARGNEPKPSSGPRSPVEQGPGRWNRDSGTSPSTTTTRIPRSRAPKAS